MTQCRPCLRYSLRHSMDPHTTSTEYLKTKHGHQRFREAIQKDSLVSGNPEPYTNNPYSSTPGNASSCLRSLAEDKHWEPKESPCQDLCSKTVQSRSDYPVQQGSPTHKALFVLTVPQSFQASNLCSPPQKEHQAECLVKEIAHSIFFLLFFFLSGFSRQGFSV